MYPTLPQRKDPLKDIQYPDPPHFYRNYSKDAIRRGMCFPPPPLPTAFQIFGEVYDLKAHVIPPVETKGVQRVFGEIHGIGDIRDQMIKINRSIMAAFIDLTQILIENPQSDDRIEKINNIRVLFLNFHNLINELRPVQARATLVANQKSKILRTQKLEYDITETLAATQAALLTAKLLPRKLPTIPVPLMPELDEEEALSLEAIDYISLMEPTAAEDDFTEIFTEKKTRKQLQEEAYILQHWKEPPKKLKERYIYRDKLIALKDEEIKYESSDEDADDERTDDELDSTSDEEENQEEQTNEEAETEMEVDVEVNSGDETEKEESDIEDSSKGSPRYHSPPPPEVQKLLQASSRDSEVIDEPEVRELRREIIDDEKEILQGMPKYYDQKAFEEYFKARGVAPDQDEEVLEVLRKKRERIQKLQEKTVYLSSDSEESGEEEEGSKEPPTKKQKLHLMEVIDDDAIPPTTTIIDDGDEDESGEEEIIEHSENQPEKEAQIQIQKEQESDEESEAAYSSDLDSSDFSFNDFSEVENSSDLSSDSSDNEAFYIESAIEATIGIPSKRRLQKADEEDDEPIRKPRKPSTKPKHVQIESSGSDSDVETSRKSRKKAKKGAEVDSERSSDESDSEVIEPDPASGSTLEEAGTLPSQEDSDALLVTSPDNVDEEEAMEASDNEDSHEAVDQQRPESLQELNRPSPVASSSPFDDDQPPILEPEM
uniref:Mediator of RNA polymerase II transcription subunit 7 n=1 Tax=Panagrolaimus sp. ES5 TaxID=591445 RepID=A0AC34GVU9_9BILA